MSTALLGEIPFKTVYLHGLVRDGQGRKISKSLGGNIDPVDMITKYGADALRMSLIIGTGPGNDSRLSDEKLKAYKNFANKIWNATRFVLTSLEDLDTNKKPELTVQDRVYVEELNNLLQDITTDMNNFRFYLTGEKLYHYFWHRFADIIIEESKPIINGTDGLAKASRQWLLLTILQTCLKALHPFMPFITEEIWGSLPKSKKSDHPDPNSLLLVETWPGPISL